MVKKRVSTFLVCFSIVLGGCGSSGSEDADDGGTSQNDAAVCVPDTYCDDLSVVERLADCSEAVVQTCAAGQQLCVDAKCVFEIGQPCAADAECASGRCAGPESDKRCTDGSQGQSCDDDFDCAPEAPHCVLNSCETCLLDCAGYECGSDCLGICALGCASTEECDASGDLVDDHQIELVASLEGLSTLVAVPSQPINVPPYDVYLCPDGGCYVWLEVLAASLLAPAENRVRIALEWNCHEIVDT